ncbi:hypothetical protein DFS33DRAFT_1439813 [Desarmillaria ectypa]|nr:hypothetical protein DFS33DRAFT_1439813 [Desarmillaria ectypa]
MEDGHASLLISHTVEDIQRPRPIIDDEASGRPSNITAERSNEESQEEYDLETTYDDESSSDSDTSYKRMEASTDPTSAQSSYVPLDAHILAHWRHPNSVVLPYLCATDQEDIFSLMSSVLYQRSTWGISEPVVGIILSKIGFVGRVVLGWLDEEHADPDVLPTARFAYGDETRTDSSLGVYDLTDPMVGVSLFGVTLVLHVFNSDADHRGPSEPSSTHRCLSAMADSEKRVTQSASKSRSAHRPRRSMSADSKRAPSPVAPAQYLPDIDPAYPREPSFEALGSKTPSDRASAQPAERGRQEAMTDGGSSDKGRTGKRLKSADALSFSSEKGINAPEEINEMLKIYENMTRYMKPPITQACTSHILACNELLVVDNAVEEVRDHFLMQIGACPDGETTPELPQPFWEVILGRFSSLLWTSVGGYSKELAGKLPNEAEARHDWDVLLNFGFMTAHELTSGRVVLERAMLLSRNIAADVMKASPNSDGAEFKTFATQMHKIAVQHITHTPEPASTSADESDLLLQSTEFVLVALRHLQAVKALFRDSETARNAILKRSGDEPELGIVDAILTVPLERMQSILEPLIHVAETRETLQASTRTLSAVNIAEPEEEVVVSEERVQTSRSSRPDSKHARSTKSRSQLGSISEDQGGIGQAPKQRTGRKKATDVKENNRGQVDVDKKWLHPFAVTCSETKSAPKMVFAPGVVMNVKELLTKLLLAVLVAEYKKPTQTYAKALVQAKMYLEASIRYLASLGVTKKAVFALATDDVEGAVLIAWCSSDSKASSSLLLL